MSLRERVAVESKPKAPHNLCSICWMLTRLAADAPDEHDALEVMLRDEGRWSAAAIEQALRDEFDVEIGSQSADRHRRFHVKGEA